MKIYIASMNMRGKWAERPQGTKILNVTSMQSKTNPNRQFSPMTQTKYKGFFCFENYWQSGKVIEGVDQTKHKNFWKKQNKGKRRYPGSKGLKVLHSNYDGTIRDKITSRKQVYVPEYYSLVQNKQILKKWISEKSDIVVYDFDGPRNNQGKPICQQVTLDLLIDKINDSKFPFGHGYIIAAALAGFVPSDYC